jgi:hypothetical protein
MATLPSFIPQTKDPIRDMIGQNMTPAPTPTNNVPAPKTTTTLSGIKFSDLATRTSTPAPKREPVATTDFGMANFSSVAPQGGTQRSDDLAMKSGGAFATQQPKSERDTFLDQYKATQSQLLSRGDRQAELEKEFGVSQKAEQLAVQTEKAARIERAYENQRRQMQENSGGMLKEQLTGNLENLRRKESQELADVAIVTTALQGNLQVARDLVADKVKAEFEPLEQQLVAMQNFYSMFQDDLSSSEKIALQAQIERQQFDYQNQVSGAIATQELSSFLEAYEVGGIDSVPKDMQAQVLAMANQQGIASPTDKKKVQSAQDVLEATNRLEEVMGGATSAIGPGIERALGSVVSFFGLNDKKNVEAEIDRVKSLLSIDNLEKFRGLGPMSEREFKAAADAASSLRTDMSEASFRTELSRIQERMENGILYSIATDTPTRLQTAEMQVARKAFVNGLKPSVQDIADMAQRRVEEVEAEVYAQPMSMGGGNVPQRNNNPGNIKSGGLADDMAIGTDEQGHLIFPDAQTGLRALQMDIQAKVNGNSRFLPANPTVAQLGKVYAEDPNWATSVSKILGVSPSTKTQDIPIEQLTNAIMRQEGYFA